MISIIVCTYNRQNYLKIALESIVHQERFSLPFEIIIINNNSPDDTEKVALDFIQKNDNIDCRYIFEKRQGISYARSRGFEESKYKFVAYSDDDAYYSANYFYELEKLIFQNPEVNAFGGKVLLDYEGGVPPRWETKYLSSILGYFNKGDQEHFFTNDYARGANMVFTRSLIKEVGAFNYDLGRTGGDMNGGEEKDIAEKIYKIGQRVLYSPKLVVYHAVPKFRTKNEFVKKQALGIGYSEKILAKSKGRGAILTRAFGELIKWGGSIVLFFLYLFKGQPAKGIMIVKFRWWVSKGLFF